MIVVAIRSALSPKSDIDQARVTRDRMQHAAGEGLLCVRLQQAANAQKCGRQQGDRGRALKINALTALRL